MNKQYCKKNKKGFMANIAVWIIILSSIVIMTIIIVRQYSSLPGFEPEVVKCAEHINADAKLGKSIEINCPTQERSISGSKEKVFSQLAQDMVSCKNLWSPHLFREDGVYCHVCTHTTIESKESLSGFESFLRTEPGKVTYMQKLIPELIGDEFENEKVNQGTALDTTKQYATIYYVLRGEDKIELFGEKLFSKDALQRPLAAGVVSVVGVYTGVAIGGVVCAASIVCGIAAGVTTGVATFATALGLDYYLDDDPHMLSVVVLREWNPEVVSQMGCEYTQISEK